MMTEKIKMESIHFIWSESNSIPDDTVVTTWQAAQALVSAAVAEAEQYGILGYFKTKFLITWVDGETYEGRLDISPREDWNLAQHVIDFARFHGGMYADNELPSHFTPASYKSFIAARDPDSLPAYKELLDKYELVVDVWAPQPGDYDQPLQYSMFN
jgi:hypothetical protein